MSNDAYALKGNLTEGPVREHLTRLTVPMIGGLLAVIGFQVADIYFVGLLGADALAAISFTFPVTMLAFNILIGLGIAMSSVLSRSIGKGDAERTEHVTAHGLIIAFVLGCTLTLIGFLTVDPVFSALGTPAKLLPMVRDYMDIWFLGLPLIALPLAGNAAIRATGDTFTQATIMIGAMLINVALNPLLVFGLWGFPRMEVAGSALATLISYALAMLAGQYVLMTQKKLISFRSFIAPGFLDSFKSLMAIAVPVSITNAIQPVVTGVITALLALSGTAAVAAFGIASRIEALSFVVMIALAVAMAPLIGQNWGARKFDRVELALKDALLFSIFWSLGSAVILMLARDPIARAFTTDPATVHAAGLYLLIVPPTYWLGNLIQGWASAFNAMGQPQKSFMILMIRMVFIGLPAAWLGHLLFGWVGVFISIALANAFIGGLFHLLSWRSFYRSTQQAL